MRTIPLKESDAGYAIVTDIALSLEQFQQTPTLLLWGKRDFVFDMHYFNEWQKRMPNAESQVWGDCGHYLLEDAGDEVIARITRFLQEHP